MLACNDKFVNKSISHLENDIRKTKLQALSSGRLAGRITARYIHGEISSLEAYQNAMRIKLMRLIIEYNRRRKAIEPEERFVKTY